jgi:hypothetical protein
MAAMTTDSQREEESNYFAPQQIQLFVRALVHITQSPVKSGRKSTGGYHYAYVFTKY